MGGTSEGEVKSRERKRERVVACIFKCVECSVDVQLLFQVRQAKRGKSWYIRGIGGNEGRREKENETSERPQAGILSAARLL